MATKEIIYTQKMEVACAGKEAPFDHPLVYLKLDPQTHQVECPYCSKTFIFNINN